MARASIADWRAAHTGGAVPSEIAAPSTTFLARVQHMPDLVTEWAGFKLWPAQITAIRNLEASLAQNKPRVLPLSTENWPE